MQHKFHTLNVQIITTTVRIQLYCTSISLFGRNLLTLKAPVLDDTYVDQNIK